MTLDEDTLRKIETLSENVKHFETLESLMGHVSYVADDFKTYVKQLEEMGEREAIRKFEHLHSVLVNLVGYSYVTIESTYINIFKCKEEIKKLKDTNPKDKVILNNCLRIIEKHLPEHREVEI